jgi:hypothetical protein
MNISPLCLKVFGSTLREKRGDQEMHIFLCGISDTVVFLFPPGFRYNMNVTMATMTKIITSHFAISIVKPAIPFMPRIKNTRASTRKTTAR